jgi:hypothetical protein
MIANSEAGRMLDHIAGSRHVTHALMQFLAGLGLAVAAVPMLRLRVRDHPGAMALVRAVLSRDIALRDGVGIFRFLAGEKHGQAEQDNNGKCTSEHKASWGLRLDQAGISDYRAAHPAADVSFSLTRDWFENPIENLDSIYYLLS